jgi:hypothetical protein
MYNKKAGGIGSNPNTPSNNIKFSNQYTISGMWYVQPPCLYPLWEEEKED